MTCLKGSKSFAWFLSLQQKLLSAEPPTDEEEGGAVDVDGGGAVGEREQLLPEGFVAMRMLHQDDGVGRDVGKQDNLRCGTTLSDGVDDRGVFGDENRVAGLQVVGHAIAEGREGVVSGQVERPELRGTQGGPEHLVAEVVDQR